VVAFPFRKGAKNPAWVGTGSGYAMNAATSRPELAWQIIRYMAGQEGQSRMARTGLAQPSMKTLAESKVFLDGQKPLNKKIMLKAAENCLLAYRWKPYIEFRTATFLPATDAIFSPGFDGDIGAVLKELEVQANQKYLKK
jgi:ABC-type glycerol-3-phosphate transport system substrate-binding protein